MAITPLDAALEDERYCIGMDRLVQNDRTTLRDAIAKFEAAATK